MTAARRLKMSNNRSSGKSLLAGLQWAHAGGEQIIRSVPCAAGYAAQGPEAP
jgi:hypothetical protein